MENYLEMSWKLTLSLKYVCPASQEDLRLAVFLKVWWICEKWYVLEGATNKLKSKKMRTDESYKMVQTKLKNDQSLGGKHMK